MKFSQIPGHKEVKAKLIRSVREDRLAHALLFAGEEGSWNLPLALALSTYIHCENRGEEDSCGECQSCSQSSHFVHPDLNFVFPLTSQKGVKSEDLISRNYVKQYREFLAKSSFQDLSNWSLVIQGENKPFNISKGESRQIIKDVSLKSFSGGYKITIIWLAEYMHPSAANGILKVLEEPTERTVFMLVSNDPERLLGTIVSRSRQIVVKKPSAEDIATWLEENNICGTDESTRLARMADGNLSTALSLKEDSQDKMNSFFREWLLACHYYQFDKLVDFTEKFSKMSKVAQKGFLQYGQTVMRESFMNIIGLERSQILTEEFNQFIGKLSSQMNESKIERFTQLMSETSGLLDRNANTKVTFLNFSLKTAGILRK